MAKWQTLKEKEYEREKKSMNLHPLVHSKRAASVEIEISSKHIKLHSPSNVHNIKNKKSCSIKMSHMNRFALSNICEATWKNWKSYVAGNSETDIITLFY